MANEMYDYEQLTGTDIGTILLSPCGLYSNVDRDSVIELGHSIQDLVRECSYLADECDMNENWEYFIDSEYFNCYTFTGGAKSGSSASGPSNGLSLVVYMENLVKEFETMNETYDIYSSLAYVLIYTMKERYQHQLLQESILCLDTVHL